MAYAQRYNAARDMMELVDTDTGQLVMSSPVAPLSQSVLQKYQSFPDYQPSAPATLGNLSDSGTSIPAQRAGASGSWDAALPAPGAPDPAAPAVSAQPKAPGLTDLGLMGPNPGVTRGFEQMREGYMESQKVASKAADEMARIQQTYTDRAAAEFEQQKKNETERNDQLKKMQTDYQALSNELRSSTIDPNRWYGSRTTGQKVQTAIGLALSGLADAGAVFSGRGRADHFDRAMGAINTFIDRDIAMQKYAIDQKKAAVGDKLNIYNMMLRQFGDERNAEQATRLHMLEDTKNQLLSTELRYKSPQIQANAKEMLGKIAVQEQQIQTQMSESILGHLAKLQEARAKQTEVERELYVQGAGMAPDKETARKAREALALKDNLIMGIDSLINLRKEKGVEVFNTPSAARGKATAADLAAQLKNLYQLGALSQSDYDLLYSVIPKDPTGYGWNLERLQTLRDLTVDKTRNLMTRYGLGGSDANVGAPGERKL